MTTSCPTTRRAWKKLENAGKSRAMASSRNSVSASPGPSEMLAVFTELDAHLRAADCNPSVVWFFGHVAAHDPATATVIATRLVETASESPLTRAWPALIEISAYGTEPIVALTRRAFAQPGTEAACAAISFLIDRHDPEPPLTADERALALETATRARQNEIELFLRVLEFRGPKDESFLWEIIARLRLEASPDVDTNCVLRILSAHCCAGRPRRCARQYSTRKTHYASGIRLKSRPGRMAPSHHSIPTRTPRFLTRPRGVEGKWTRS